MGNIIDAEKIVITETNSFQWVSVIIMSLEAKNDETCFKQTIKYHIWNKLTKTVKEKNNSVKLLQISVLLITMKYILLICFTTQYHVSLCPVKNL